MSTWILCFGTASWIQLKEYMVFSFPRKYWATNCRVNWVLWSSSCNTPCVFYNIKTKQSSLGKKIHHNTNHTTKNKRISLKQPQSGGYLFHFRNITWSSDNMPKFSFYCIARQSTFLTNLQLRDITFYRFLSKGSQIKFVFPW